MVKKAVLVEFSIMTRVIVDVPEGESIHSDALLEVIGLKAVNRIREYVLTDEYYPYIDNIVEIEEDLEVPFGTIDEDEEWQRRELK